MDAQKPLLTPLVEKDSIQIQLGKRLFTLFPLLAMAFSTLSQIFMIAKNIAAKTGIDSSYDEKVVVTSNGQSNEYTCNYGNADAVIVFCPYTIMVTFQIFLSLWIIYFTLFLFIRISATIRYPTSDLRFYIATDQYNTTIINKVFIYLGIILTFASVIVSLYYMSPQTNWNPTLDTPNLLSIIVFLGINLISLSRFRKSFIRANNNDNNHYHYLDMNDFQEYIPMQEKMPFWTNLDEIMKPIVIVYLQYLLTGDEIELSHYGDIELIQRTINKLYQLKKLERTIPE
jgi:hypothetical protein